MVPGRLGIRSAAKALHDGSADVRGHGRGAAFCMLGPENGALRACINVRAVREARAPVWAMASHALRRQARRGMRPIQRRSLDRKSVV